MVKEVIIYTDGACSYNPGPGGWAAVLIYKGVEKEISGFCPQTTNNRMEMFAVINALEALKEPCSVKLYSDSAYVINAFKNGWVNSWVKNNWKTADKSEVKNVDLWQDLIRHASRHRVEWIKVKGHADNPYNNRCDELARGEIKRMVDNSL